MNMPGHVLQRLVLSATCVACLAFASAASAGKPQPEPVSCVIFPPAYIDTGFPFTLKIVRYPSYPGSWVAPTVTAAAEFAMMDGSKSVVTDTHTTSRYGVTYVYATLLAPKCDGSPCAVNTSVEAVITAVVKEPVVRGNKVSYRETSCFPVQVAVNPAM